MYGNIPACARVEANVVRVGVPDTVRAKSLRGVFVFSPVDGPRHHVVVARAMNPAEGASTLVGPMHIGQNTAADRDQIPGGKVARGRGKAGVIGRKGVVLVFWSHGWRLAAASDTEKYRYVSRKLL